MIKRRTFIGSVTAMFAAGSSRMAGARSYMNMTSELERLDWDCEIIETVSHRSDHRKPVVTGVDVDSDGKLMAVVGDDHFVSVYDFRNSEFADHLDRHTDWVRTARFSHQGDLLATAGNDRQLFIWNSDDLTSPALSTRNPEAIIEVAFNSDDSMVATVGFESWLRVFDATDGTLVRKLNCACPDNHAVAFSADGKQIAAAGRCGNVRVWDVDTGKQISEYKAHRKRVRSLEFSIDGVLVSGGDDQRISIFDPNGPNRVRTMPRLASKLYSVQLMADGLFATGGSDNRIHLSRLSDGSVVGTLEGHTGTVSCLSVMGEKLVSGSYDTQVRVWSPARNAHAVDGNQGHGRHTQLDQGWTNKR